MIVMVFIISYTKGRLRIQDTCRGWELFRREGDMG